MINALNEEDFQDFLLAISPLLETIAVTDKHWQELTLVCPECVAAWKYGSRDAIIWYLWEEFVEFESDLNLPPDWELQIGIVPENAGLGYIEITWCVRMTGAGSMNCFNVVIRRAEDWFELLLPEIEE